MFVCCICSFGGGVVCEMLWGIKRLAHILCLDSFEINLFV